MIVPVCLALMRSCLEYRGWFQAPSLRDTEGLGRVQCLGAEAHDTGVEVEGAGFM